MTLAVTPQDLLNNRDIATEVRERSQESFKAFIHLAWDVIEPGTPLLWNWHIDAISDHLESVCHGDITRLICNIAPGHAKSTIFSVMYPCWTWIKDPTVRWLCASHSLDLAIRDNRNCRTLIESEWFQLCFGDIFQLSSDQNVKSFFENDRRGYRMALSVGAKGTGRRGSHLLIDDPNDAKATKVEVEETIRWFGNTWISRINSYSSGAMIVVGQRLYERDLTGHILELGGWEHLCLPEEFEPSRRCFTSVVSTSDNSYAWKGYDPREEEGELLWPDKFPVKVLADLKKSMRLDYFAQFQQRPMPEGGGQFRREWFRYFTETSEAYILETERGTRSVLKDQCWMFGTVDLAISLKQTADYTVFGVWAVTPERDLLLVDLVRAHFSNPEQVKQLRLLHQRHPQAYRWKIERVGYQLALIQQALAEGIPCSEYNPVGKGDKVARASTPSVWFENGKVYFRKFAAWVSDVESELMLFPRGAHDDIVDVCSMAADEVVVSGIVLAPDDDEDDEKSEIAVSTQRANPFDDWEDND